MKILKLFPVKFFIAALALTATHVFAQAQAPADADQKAAVRELLDAINFKQMMSQMAGAMSQSMPQMVEQTITAEDDGDDGKNGQGHRSNG